MQWNTIALRMATRNTGNNMNESHSIMLNRRSQQQRRTFSVILSMADGKEANLLEVLGVELEISLGVGVAQVGIGVLCVLVLSLSAGYSGVFSLLHLTELMFYELGCMNIILKTQFKKKKKKVCKAFLPCSIPLNPLPLCLSGKSLHRTNFCVS